MVDKAESIKVTEDLIMTTDKTIRPYKLNALMKTASKVVDMLTKVPEFILTYEDIEFVLGIVSGAVKRAKGEKNV